MTTSVTPSTDSRLIAVVGATGNQGGSVVDALLARGARVRALVRDLDAPAARRLADRGVELTVGDLTDAGSLDTLFDGVDAAFAMTTPIPGGTEQETAVGIAIVEAAARARVPHLVFSSVGGAERKSGVPHFESKRRVEERIESLGIHHTFLRPVFFMENLAGFSTSVEGGQVVVRMAMPGDIPLHMVAVADIGKAAAAILRGGTAVEGTSVEIAGDSLTGEQIARAIGAHAGLPARYEALPLEAIASFRDTAEMFRWFAETPAYQGDFAATRALVPDVLDFPSWLGSSGWNPNTQKAVRYDEFGGIDVLRVDEVARPVPGDEQVLVRVKAAGINPSEAVIRTGALAQIFPSTFPSGQGSDLAGVIEEVGAGVAGFSPGDEVIGFSNTRSSQAELVLVEAGDLTRKPANVPWEVAGGLYVVGVTAWGAVHSVRLRKGETVVVSGAAGGVGSLAVQLARRTGATVIGLSSESNHKWLEDHKVIPIAYGDGVADRIRAAAPGGVDAFIDTHGDGYVELALALGVAPERIDTITDFAAAAKYGAKTDGGAAAGPGAKVLAELAGLLADGHLELPIANVYPLARVREAYTELERRHTRGKIVLRP